MGKITIVLEESGRITAEVDADEYAEAKEAGQLDHLLDVWASDMDSDITVTEPDGTTFDLHGGDYEPRRPASAWAMPAEPGPEVTAVRAAGERVYDHVTTDYWRYRVTPTAAARGISGSTFTWTELIRHGPLTDATPKS